MDHLEEIDVDDLHDVLERVDGKKPTQRLLAAIAYKNGVTQTELAEWHDVDRRTIYGWLERFDADSIRRAVEDGERPGRPRKLDDDERADLERTLRESPTAVGYDERTWTPRLVRTHLEDAYGVEYSIPSCRRLMREAGLRYSRSTDDATRDDERDRSGSWTRQ